MDIIEQVKELRELSEIFEGKRIGRVLGQAANTIEALSAKLQAANMERSDRYYKIQKELVKQHNKAFELINKMPLEGNEVWHGYVGGVMQTFGFLIDYMERSAGVFGGGWIPCENGLPEDGVDVLVWFEYFRYGEYNRLFQTTGISYTYNDQWSGFVNGQSGWNQLSIIAWQPMPEDYRP